MTYCEKCGAANQEGARFCQACGHFLAATAGTLRCPNCQEPNPSDSLFCSACGAWLSLASQKPAEPGGDVVDHWLKELAESQPAEASPPEVAGSQAEPPSPPPGEDAGLETGALGTASLEWVRDVLRPPSEAPAEAEGVSAPSPIPEEASPSPTDEEAGSGIDDTDTLTLEWVQDALRPVTDDLLLPEAEGEEVARREPPSEREASPEEEGEAESMRGPREEAVDRGEAVTPSAPEAIAPRPTDEDAGLRPTSEDAGPRPMGEDAGLETGALGTASLEWVRDVLQLPSEDLPLSEAPAEAEGVSAPPPTPEEVSPSPADEEAWSGIDDTDTLTLEWVQDALRPVTGDLRLPEAEGEEVAGREPPSKGEVSPEEEGEAESTREPREEAIDRGEAVTPSAPEAIAPRPTGEDAGLGIDDTGTLSLDWVRGVLESWPEDLLQSKAPAKAKGEAATPPASEDARLRPTGEDAGLRPTDEDAGLRPTDEDAGLRPTDVGPSEHYEKPPDWVRELRASTPSEVPLTADEETEAAPSGEGTRGRIDEPILADPGEEAGILAGVKGVLPLEPALAWPHLPQGKPSKATSADDLSQAEALQEVMAHRIMVEGQIPARGAHGTLPSWGYRVIFAMVLLAVVVPFLLQSDWSGTSISVSSEVGSFFDTVEALPPGSHVLMSFDYDPATAEEMDPQARIIMDQLMRKGVSVLTMSLTPQGAAIAQQMLNSIEADYSKREYGKSYVNLGYLSGNEVALRAILVQGLPSMFLHDYRDGQPVSGFSAMQGISHLEDVEAIIDVAGDARFVRWWVEQVGSRSEVPLLAAVSGTALVGAEPYYRSGQLQGIMGGIAGAAEYEIANNSPGRAVAAMDSQSAVHVLVVLLILVGNVAYIFGASRGEG